MKTRGGDKTPPVKHAAPGPQSECCHVADAIRHLTLISMAHLRDMPRVLPNYHGVSGLRVVDLILWL
jgi:hypothetical protein